MNSLFVRFLWVGVPFLWILGLHAQGNLQFNQVKLVQAIDSVPQNKVWKVESAVLGISQGIRVSPTFYINGDTVVLGYDSYNVSRWENVTSVVVQVRGQLCNTVVRMRFLGSGGGSAIDQDNSSANLNSTYNQFTTVATFTPPSPGNNEIDRWNFWLAGGVIVLLEEVEIQNLELSQTWQMALKLLKFFQMVGMGIAPATIAGLLDIIFLIYLALQHLQQPFPAWTVSAHKSPPLCPCGCRRAPHFKREET